MGTVSSPTAPRPREVPLGPTPKQAPDSVPRPGSAGSSPPGDVPLNPEPEPKAEKGRLQKVTENPVFRALLPPSKLVVGGLKKGAGKVEKGGEKVAMIAAGAVAGAAAGAASAVTIEGAKQAIKRTPGTVRAVNRAVKANAKWARRTKTGRAVRKLLGIEDDPVTKPLR